MAKAGTFDLDSIDGYVTKKNCAICGKASKHRAFYNPSCMNGDAMWLGDYCKEHKKTDLKKVLHGEIKTKYPVDTYKNNS